MKKIKFRPLFANKTEDINDLFCDIITAKPMNSMILEEHHHSVFAYHFPLTRLTKETKMKISDYLSKTYNLGVERIYITHYIYLKIERKTGLCSVSFGKYDFTFNEGPLLDVPFPLNGEPFVRNSHIHIAERINQSIHFTLLDSPFDPNKKSLV